MKKNTITRALSLLLTFLLLTGAVAGAALAVTARRDDNAAPVAEDLDYTTYRNIAITGTFSATDTDGDELSFTVVEQPKKGSVTVGEGGSFVYTPDKDKKGRDYFTYTASDAAGNTSSPATVKINIKKQSSKVTYSDMDGSAAHYAAVYLAENGIFTGEQLGSEHFFRPDAPVSRGEFLAMCLNVCGCEMIEGVTRTGFYDDDEIPAWAKSYVSSALMSGIISGYRNEDGKLVFSPDSPITFSEASVMLDNALGIGDIISVGSFSSDFTPAWAYQATINMNAYKILPDGVSDTYTETLTRADAAEMIVGAAEVMSARSSGSLLSWAKN